MKRQLWRVPEISEETANGRASMGPAALFDTGRMVALRPRRLASRGGWTDPPPLAMNWAVMPQPPAWKKLVERLKESGHKSNYLDRLVERLPQLGNLTTF